MALEMLMLKTVGLSFKVLLITSVSASSAESGETTIAELIKRLAHENPQVRQDAAEGLAEAASAAGNAVPALVVR